jgi:hypothetical protein
MSAADEIGSWPEYRRHLLSELERIDEGLKDLNAKLDRQFNERDDRLRKAEANIAVLQFKCGVWGALAGVGGAVAVLLLRLGIH